MFGNHNDYKISDNIMAYIKRHKKAPEFYYVSLRTFLQMREDFILNRTFLSTDAPTPPVKRKYERHGFFSSEYETEYDYHAPEYLKQLENFSKLCERMSIENEEIRKSNQLQYLNCLGGYTLIKPIWKV